MNPMLCNGCGQNNSKAAAYRKKKLLKSNSDICCKNTLLELTFTGTQITHCVSTANCATSAIYYYYYYQKHPTYRLQKSRRKLRYNEHQSRKTRGNYFEFLQGSKVTVQETEKFTSHERT